jgi:DNA polymerase III alpha subunit
LVPEEGLPERDAALPELSDREEVFEDYVAARLSLRAHPVILMRPEIEEFVSADALREAADGGVVSVAGLVITRQRPGTSNGVILLTLEDDTSVSNIVAWPKTFEAHRKSVMTGRLLRITDRLQREGIVSHVVARQITDLSPLLDTLGDADAAGGHINPSRDDAEESQRPGSTGSHCPHRKPPSEEFTAELQRTRILRYGTGARHPREQAKKLFYSRDFH